MAEDNTLLIIGAAALAGVVLWNKYKQQRNEATILEAEQNAQPTGDVGEQYSIDSAQRSVLNPDVLMLRTEASDGTITSYRYDPSEHNFLQNWAVSKGYYRVKDGELQIW